MTISEVLQLPDDTEIDRVSGTAECWAQETAESTGGNYTYQNGRYSDNGSSIRLRMNNCIPLPATPTPVEFCGPGVVKKTFRNEPQIYITGRATVVPAATAPPPASAVPTVVPAYDPAAPPNPTDFPAAPPPPPPPADDLFPPPPADSLGVEYVSTLPPPATAPAVEYVHPNLAPAPTAIPNGSGELADHFVVAVRIALDVCARTGIEFYPELVATIIIDAQRRGVTLK